MALISCFNILTSFAILMVFLPSQLEAYYTPNTGCHHNGTWYADKSLVPTTEKCLNCQCNKKTLVCRLKVCPEMPMPPPRGCVVVQKKNTCCPYLSCARLDAFYKIPATRRIIAYLDHYERESIDRVVNENMLQRRSDDTDVDLYVCVKNGTVYKSGSAMSSSNLCSYCYCIGGTEKCVKPKCMLPVEGCKPIFVDSTCCPVRYDCSTKQTGKSSQEVRYRKTSNKHYMRMSQRLQRNHGCTVGQQFYTEGQKMKSDKDKPCDICFCIRGQRKCAPKKCAPALRNCIPVVPKGQCCPSSYDCGSQRDYRRSQNSRQFNLFSLLFGKDEDQDENTATEIPVQYPHDREPVSLRPLKNKASITEKSIFDSIREGLEFIDNNNNQMIKDNMDLVATPSQKIQHKHTRPSPTPIPLHNIPSTTEVSFLDLLLGPSEPNKEKTETSSEEMETAEEKTTPTSTGIHWVDLLLGPDQEDVKNSDSTISDKVDKPDTTTEHDQLEYESTTLIAHVKQESFIDSAESVGELDAEQHASTTDMTITTEPAIEETTQSYTTVLPETTSTTRKTTIITTTTTRKPITMTTRTPFTTTTNRPTKTANSNQTIKPLHTKENHYTGKNHTQPKPEKNSDFLAQLLDGLSGILAGENKTRNNTPQLVNNKHIVNRTTTMKLPTPKPMPLFKPLPQDKTYTRINSKIANLTVKPPVITNKNSMKSTFKPLAVKDIKTPAIPLKATKEELQLSNTAAATTTFTTQATTTVTTSAATTTTTTTALPTTSTTSKPVVIKTNPTILESEPLDQNSEPTLPPSLPNLKIIPFLPTDAVKADHNQASSYEYYHHSSAPISRIDYDLYDDANLYPSITEKYPLYPDLEDGSKAEYIYKFNVEGPDTLVSSNAGKFDGTLGSPAFLKYDFAGSGTPSPTKGFSPPTKTEGGFMPKEPLILDDDDHDNVSVKVGDSYHVTQHIIDITTSGDVFNTTKVIEITTPDPFKDVLRTETPPDLTSLIEDKLKNLISKSSTTTKTTTSASSQSNKKPQNTPEFEMNSKQTNPMNTKTTTQIKMTATHVANNNDGQNNGFGFGFNKTQADVGEKTMQHRITTQTFGDDMDDDDGEANADVNDVSTIPPFKSLSSAAMVAQQQLAQQEDNNTTTLSKGTMSKESVTSQTNNKLKQTETTIRPTGSTTPSTRKMNTTATTKRPAAAATIKVNRNKTIATTTYRTKQTLAQQQKPSKMNKNSTLNGSEVKTLASSTTSYSSSSSSSSAGSVSTLKTKSNATRRVASTKPTKHNKPTTNTTTPATATIKSTPEPNAINIDRTSVVTRRTAKPTVNANITKTSTTITTTTTATKKATATTKPTTTLRTTTSLPASPLTIPLATLQKAPTINPFFMSPFDKLPFMDASFEVKRYSATPSTTTTTTSPKQHFAVAATITADALLDNANDEQVEYDSSATSSRHKLMGLVHYKHTLNQLEGLEPTTQQRPQHYSYSAPVSDSNSNSPTSSHLTFSQFNSQVSSPSSSTSTSQQQPAPQPSSSLNNLIDPTGILKLAGCNIYGRMYRVGRIILELSSPCLECKCTEIGVKCGPLDC